MVQQVEVENYRTFLKVLPGVPPPPLLARGGDWASPIKVRHNCLKFFCFVAAADDDE